MTEKMIYVIISLGLFLMGMSILFQQDWHIMVGVFLVVHSYDVARRSKDKNELDL